MSSEKITTPGAPGGTAYRFHNKEIQKAFDAIADDLTSFESRLTEVNEDIRTLERGLQDAGFCRVFETHHLKWAQHGDRWRLLFKGGHDASELKPLIETGANVRWSCAKQLADFVQKCMVMVKGDLPYVARERGVE